MERFLLYETCREKVGTLLDRLRLEHGNIDILATPRRLVIHARSVASRQSDISEKLRGPPAKVAFYCRELSYPFLTVCLSEWYRTGIMERVFLSEKTLL